MPYRVLVVDNDQGTLALHSQALVKEGMLVESLTDPMQTLDTINKFEPELILLDTHMSKCSGLEIAALVRQNSAFDHLPIVFLSSKEDIKIHTQAIKYGDEIITKPVNLDYLTTALQVRIERARNLAESRNADKITIKNLTEAKKLAEQANKKKSEFISKMSHELRTPLNTILGYTQLLEIDHDNNLSDSQKSNIQHILNSGWHLLALINDVLDISKIEIGHLSLANTETNLDAIITSAITEHENDARNKNITITYANDCLKDITVYADATRLKQVLSNLLSNAIKYNVDGGTVDVNVNASDLTHCKVIITDTGSGFPEDKLSKLFEPFNRLGLEETNIEGNGIGLALSSQLVELMDGEIGAFNNDQAGASFWFTLNHYTQPESFQTDDNLVINILYVEENEMDFQLLSKSLSAQSNINLLTARGAESALNLAHKMLPDVILLDIELSSMDGNTMLNAIRTNKKLRQVPIFALSLDDVPLDKQALGDEQFYKYFNKPYNITKLIESIGDVLENEHANATIDS